MINEFSSESIGQEVVEPKLLFVRPELLAHPTLPEPLHGLNPRTIMGAKKWDEVRRNAYSVNNYHCFACGTYAEFDSIGNKFAGELKLHAHECYEYNYNERTAELVEVVALCPICHDGIHINRLQSLYAKGVIDEEYMYAVYSNKENVLGLDDSNWSKWKLNWEGKEYFSNFKDKKEWEEHYGNK